MSVLLAAVARSWSWIDVTHRPGKIPSPSAAQSSDLFYCVAVEVHVDFFLRANAFLQLMGFVCFRKSLSVSLGDPFPTFWQCCDVS